MKTAEAARLFLIDLANDHRSPHTIAAYRRDLDTFTCFSGDTVIDDVTPELLTKFMATDCVQLRPCGTQRAKASINRYRVSLKALFAWCEARWLVKRNPTAILRCQRYRGLPPVVLTNVETARVLGFTFAGKNGDRDSALITFMLLTGCRLGETAALNVEDISQDTGTVLLRCPKGGMPEQLITSERVCRTLDPLLNETNLGQPLFRNSTNRRLSTRQIQRIVARRINEAGIDKPVTPHTLRHSFATTLYNQTGDIRLVQKALRHEHVTTTETYAQVDPRRLRAALEHGKQEYISAIKTT